MQGVRDMLLDLLEQHQLDLDAALDLVAGALQRVADGMRADRVFLVLQLVAAEQQGNALAEQRQLVLVLLAQAGCQFLQGNTFGKIVLLHQAQLQRRGGQRLHGGIHFAAHLVVEGIDEMPRKGGLDLRPFLLGLAAHLEVEVLHLAVVARLGHAEQLFLDVAEHLAQRAGEALHRQLTAVIEHAAGFRRTRLAPFIQVDDIVQCARSHVRLHSQSRRAMRGGRQSGRCRNGSRRQANPGEAQGRTTGRAGKARRRRPGGTRRRCFDRLQGSSHCDPYLATPLP
jgi:hypothetical protein